MTSLPRLAVVAGLISSERSHEADPLLCPRCGGDIRFIASITDQKLHHFSPFAGGLH